MVEEGREADSDRGEASEAGGSAGVADSSVSLFDLVQFLAANLVLHPEAVVVRQAPAGEATSFELHVHKEDLGRVIGKQGRTAKSLRTILNAAASRIQHKATLEIIEE